LSQKAGLEYNEPAAEGHAFPVIIMFAAHQPPAVMISVHRKKFITQQATGGCEHCV